MAMQGAVHHSNVTALESQAKKSRGKTCLGRDLKGEASRERHESCTGTCALLAQPEKKDGQAGRTEETQSVLQGEEQRSYGQEAEGGERGDG